MTAPGDRRPASAGTPPPHPSGRARRAPPSRPVALLEALLAASLAALAWALLKGVFELGPGLLGVAVVGGWSIGALLWQVRATPWLAAAFGTLAWLGGLALTWLLALAMLPASSRSFIERVQGTPFLDWLLPQFGLLEVAGLALYLLAALYGARTRR
ncbi:MAG TPA: hypothetical protein VK987_09625 [Anaerolineae bacterium]|nr:hypothetical protein [Anaerolineae bacterium]